MSEAAATKPKRAMHRSPSYPMFGLSEAIGKAKIVYDNVKRSSTTPDVIAKLLGFSQHVGGPGGRTMSALRQYGLLEEADGKGRISDRAYTLIQYPQGSQERTQAIKEAIREPNLFRELLAEFNDGVPPSDAPLSGYLLRRGFNPEVIPDVVRIFRDTVALDPSQNVAYPAIQSQDTGVETVQGMETNTQGQQRQQVPSGTSGPTIVNAWTLSPDTRAELRINGKVKKEDLELLRDYVEITIKALSRKADPAGSGE
jgi:hypothetical protein